jgi:hypothetical protein
MPFSGTFFLKKHYFMPKITFPSHKHPNLRQILAMSRVVYKDVTYKTLLKALVFVILIAIAPSFRKDKSSDRTVEIAANVR